MRAEPTSTDSTRTPGTASSAAVTRRTQAPQCVPWTDRLRVFCIVVASRSIRCSIPPKGIKPRCAIKIVLSGYYKSTEVYHLARDRASTVRSYAYDDLFFHYIQQGATRSAQHIAPLVIDALGARSVLDVGCGAGAWLDVYSKLGVETCLGVDGDYVKPDMLLIPPKDFIASDISRP